MKILLDVGAHTGQTVSIAHKYPFDAIFCFEPVISCAERVEKAHYDRTTVCPYGLWNKEGDFPVYAAETLSGSVFFKRIGHEEVCRFVKASDWVRDHIAENDFVVMKLNCEGAECDIIDDLVCGAMLKRLAVVMIDFDVRKIRSQRHREQEIRTLLKEHGEPPHVIFASDILEFSGHGWKDFTRYWLDLIDFNTEKCMKIC